MWHDKRCGGQLWTHMRQATKKCRKRYRSRDSRGRLPGKRHISERPADVETRATVGHWEIDTIKGDSQATHSALTVVERKTGCLQMGKLCRHRAADASAKTIEIIGRQPHRFKTITADNSTEFHSHKLVEEAAGMDALAHKLRPGPGSGRGSGHRRNAMHDRRESLRKAVWCDSNLDSGTQATPKMLP